MDNLQDLEALLAQNRAIEMSANIAKRDFVKRKMNKAYDFIKNKLDIDRLGMLDTLAPYESYIDQMFICGARPIVYEHVSNLILHLCTNKNFHLEGIDNQHYAHWLDHNHHYETVLYMAFWLLKHHNDFPNDPTCDPSQEIYTHLEKRYRQSTPVKTKPNPQPKRTCKIHHFN